MTDKETYELAMAYVRAERERSGEVVLPKFLKKPLERILPWLKVQIRTRIEFDKRVEHLRLDRIERDDFDEYTLCFKAVDLEVGRKYLWVRDYDADDMDCPSTFDCLQAYFSSVRDNIILGTKVYTLKFID